MVKNQNNKNKKRISPNLTAIIGALVIMLGGFFLSYNYVQSMKISTYDFMASTFYSEENGEAQIKVVTNEENNEKKEEEKPEENEPIEEVPTEMYLGYLNIPKINLRKGFFPIESSQNDVERNIFIVEGSSYPDVENGNLIIAAHSGTGWKAFFNDLYKLEKNDEVTINYNEKTYVYHITKIYKQEKTGTIAIYRNYDKTTLTLVTCTNNDSKTQTVYIAELVDVR